MLPARFLALVALGLVSALPTPAGDTTDAADVDPASPAAAAADVEAEADAAPPKPPALPLRWRTRFGDSIAAGKPLKLEWHGGDENGYEVYYVPRWPGQLQYDFVTIEANTTAQTIEWDVPPLSEYPQGTEFIFGVKDGSRGPGFDWYDLSASIPLR